MKENTSIIPVSVVVQAEPFDVSQVTNQLAASSLGVGAINTFIGLVRDNNLNDEVGTLVLEHYPGMTEKQIEIIISEACERWDLLAATVIHRVGTLLPGEQIVFVGVASPHRGDAFDACEYIIDYLKTRATFWKKESATTGDRWLTTRETDVEAAKQWELLDE